MSQFLTQAERDSLKDLDRIIDWHLSNNKPLDHLVISKKHSDTLSRLAKKRNKGPVYDAVSEVEIDVPEDLGSIVYRGVRLDVNEPARRRYRKKDTESLLPETEQEELKT